MGTICIKNVIGNTAKVFTENVEDLAIEQIAKLVDYPAYRDSRVRVMPDVHAGKGCTIGTTMTIVDKLTPNLVGVDIGCGMLAIELADKEMDFAKLDAVIRERVPSGFNIHKTVQRLPQLSLKNLRCFDAIDHERALLSVGSLGGGNHFIEVDRSEKTDNYWLVIHAGSRHLGVQVCKYYQDLAIKNMKSRNGEINALIAKLKSEGRESEIQCELKKIPHVPNEKELAHLEGKDFEDYIHDMEIVQAYASSNRYTIAAIITSAMNMDAMDVFETIHNYIDTDSMILRKGAVSALYGQKLLIPMNMRDGSLICVGKGNEDWNYSAPHGAGRIMSRSKAKQVLSMEDYKSSMEGIYTTSVDSTTIDEAPMAYKPMEEIMAAIEPTCEILDIIKPVYNFKASE